MREHLNKLHDADLERITGGANADVPSTGAYNVNDAIIFHNIFAWPTDIPRPDTLEGRIVKKHDDHPLAGGVYQHFYDVEYTDPYGNRDVAVVVEQQIIGRK